MIKFLLGATVAGSVILLASAEPPKPNYDKMMTSVVRIQINDDEGDGIGKGSGVVLENGLIVSANHVTEGKDHIIGSMKDGTKFTLKVVKAIPEKDIVFLKPSINLNKNVAAKLSCKPLKIGQDIVAIGNPTFLDWITTFGKIAGARQSFPNTKNDVYITNIALAPGMSGGPVYNEAGEIVGLNDAILTYQIGYGIDMEESKGPQDIKPKPLSTATGVTIIVSGEAVCEELVKLGKNV